MKSQKSSFAFVFLILATLACGLPGSGSSPTEIPSPTIQAPVTIIVIENSPTPTATETPTATATPPLPPEITLTKNSNCRLGPSEYYFHVGQITTDTILPVIGRTSDSSWWQVNNPTSPKCWIFSENAQANQDFSAVPIEEGPALPNTPENFFVVEKKCNPGPNTFSIAFKWVSSGDGDGFRLYRNGAQIIEMDASKNRFTDKNAPLNQNLSYELFAFNKYGISVPAVQFVQACT